MASGRYQKPKKNTKLNITSLMDVMTIMLVYLLKSFSAEGQLLTTADNLVLPYSESKNSPKEVNLQVSISTEWVTVDNVPVIKVSSVRKSEDLIVPQIKAKLDRCYKQEENMVKIGAISSVKGEVVVQVDKNIPYDVLFKTMATCGEAGYVHMKFAAMSTEQ